MLRRQRQFRNLLNEVTDAGLFAVGFWLAHLCRSAFPNVWWPEADPIAAFDDYLPLWLIILPLAPIILESQGYYQRRTGRAPRRQAAWRLLRSAILAVLMVIVVMFFLRIQLSRSVVILFGPISLILMLLKEELMNRWVATRLGQSQFKRRVVLLGTEADSGTLVQDLESMSGRDLEVVARLDLNQCQPEALAACLHRHAANNVIIAGRHTYFGQIEKAIQICELEGVETWLLADFFKTEIFRTSMDDLHGRPVLVFRSTPEFSWQAFGKQVLDLVGAGCLLVLASIPMLATALAIRFTSPGPVLFRQERSGLNGQPFTMFKFRTMVTNAEQRQQEIAAFNEMDGPVFKVKDDPRITPVGKWLRRYSVDELPQLWNVLRGEMSLVGPRPLPVYEVDRFADLAYRRRLSVKPGLTCLWQISGRNNVRDFKDWVRLDLEYIDNWSLWLDLKILLRTIPVVLTGSGAH